MSKKFTVSEGGVVPDVWVRDSILLGFSTVVIPNLHQSTYSE